MKKVVSVVLCALMVISLAFSASAISSVQIKSIALDSSSLALTVGDTHNLSVTFTPSNTTQKTLKFVTSDKFIATVDAKGKVTAMNSGKVSISVISSSNSSVMAKCDVTISKGFAPATFPLTKNKVTIKVLTGYGTQTDINKNWNTIDYEKKTNVHVNWITVNSADMREKRALIIASGDLPDVFANGYNWFTAADEIQYGSQGSIIPLNKLLDTDSYYVKKILEANPLYKKIIASPDGNIYSLPTFAVCFHCNYAQKMWVNASWLKKLNMSMPKTTDEFEKMLIAFKEKDPNGNGTADEMPLTTTIDGWHAQLEGFLMNAFVNCDADSHLALNNGKIEMTATKAQFKEGLAYLNKLYKEKLISPESFTQNASSLEKLNEGNKNEIVGAVPGGANYIFAGGPAVSTRWKDYEILAPISGPSGFKSAPNYSLTRDVITGDFAISKSAKNPELIMRWVDWLYSEEGTLWHYDTGGKEGVQYRKAFKGEVGISGKPAKYAQLKNRKAEDNVVWEQFMPANMSKDFREGWASPKDWHKDDGQVAPELQLFQGSLPYEAVGAKASESIPSLFVTQDKISDYSRIKTGIDDYIKDSVSKFITGSMDLNKDWDNYVSKMNSIGLKDYLAMCQEAYDLKFKK